MSKRDSCLIHKTKHWLKVTAMQLMVGVSCAIFFVGTARAEYCAVTPPPKGLVERCQSLSLVVPGNRSELELTLVDWMGSCATKSRRFELVLNNPSVDKVWSLIVSYHNTPQGSVRIIPRYTEHLTYRQDGRTCYGIGRVEFTVWGTGAEVDADGPIEIISGPPDNLIKEAAAAAEKVLSQSSSPGSLERSKMLNVLKWMKTYGKDFDDTFYNVAPEKGGTDFLQDPPACYREFRVRERVGYFCLLDDEALKQCAWHITPLVVQDYLSKMSAAQFEEHLMALANRIHRAMQHFQQIQKADSPGAVPCPSVLALMHSAASRGTQSNTLYYAWGQ